MGDKEFQGLVVTSSINAKILSVHYIQVRYLFYKTLINIKYKQPPEIGREYFSSRCSEFDRTKLLGGKYLDFEPTRI